jgi:hypothetical protein
MQEKKLFTREDYLAEAEKLIEENYPGSVAKIHRGNSVIIIQEQAVANDYTSEDLILIGSVAKVAAHHGNVVLMARTEAILSLSYQEPKGTKGSSKEQA